MSYLLFMDESGHDHRQTPYEVRGGIALHSSQLWNFVNSLRSWERSIFGGLLHQYNSEIKGSKLLKKKRFRWAEQSPWMDDQVRTDLAKRFLERGVNPDLGAPKRREFTAFGKASIEMARKVFETVDQYDGKLFACVIDRGVQPDEIDQRSENFLRKDHVFLLERYFYFLEQENEMGLVVMDESDETLDRKFIRRMREYFTKTATGQKRLQCIVPTPLFVSSELTYPVQAADVLIYCLNWGFRLPSKGMDGETREEISEEFGWRLNRIQFHSDHDSNPHRDYESYGIVYVPDPYSSREVPT